MTQDDISKAVNARYEVFLEEIRELVGGTDLKAVEQQVDRVTKRKTKDDDGVKMVAITGNTFPIKDKLKAMGGRWNAAEKVWMVPEEFEDEAQELADKTPREEWVEGRPKKKW